MDCDAFRKKYRLCVDLYGKRECRMDLDDLFKCLYECEMNKSYMHSL